MDRNKWLIAVVALAGLVALVMLVWPAGQRVSDPATEAAQAPDFGSTIRVSNARIVLPGGDGDRAHVYFDLANTGTQTVQLTQVRLAHGTGTGMAETGGPAWTPVAALPVEAGATLSFQPGGDFAVISDYDSSVVPGAAIDVTLVFGTSGEVSVPATVFAGT
ncbi:MAG: copper chaperone PCu(A)C [Porphyrobacter sp.]|nr:copper chaperone PCu(A)C [Porphyrobacter sp.]